MASQNGHTECVQALLEKGANANQINEQNGTFPLLLAAQDGHTECVQTLLEKGANANQINEQDGIFPLLQAAQNGHTECVQALQENGGCLMPLRFLLLRFSRGSTVYSGALFILRGYGRAV